MKEICLFSRTPPIQLLDMLPRCLDMELATTCDLIDQNMIVEGYDPNDKSDHCSTFARYINMVAYPATVGSVILQNKWTDSDTVNTGHL